MFGNEKMKSKATCKLLQLVANRATEKKNKRGSDMLDQSAMLLQIVANRATQERGEERQAGRLGRGQQNGDLGKELAVIACYQPGFRGQDKTQI